MADEKVDDRVDRPPAVVPAVKKTPVADICCLDIRGLATATKNLARLPVLLAISAFDPEAWCAVIVHPGAPETAGSFRDGSCPLREWVLGSPFWANSEAAEMPIRSSIFWKPPMTPD